MNFFVDKIIFTSLSIVAIASLFSGFIIPFVRKIALTRNLTDVPSTRKSHSTPVPILGGLAVFLSIIITFFCINLFFESIIGTIHCLTLLTSAAILVLMGVYDDILGLKALIKLLIQIAVSCFVVYFCPHFSLETMHGLFSVFELPPTVSFILSVFIFIIFLNMLNLIDGIDGLASGLSSVSILFFLLISFLNNNWFTMFVCASSLGSLLPFLYFNMFSKRKIFLGDAGSLLLGLLLGFLSLEFLSSPINFSSNDYTFHFPVILMALFSYPLADTLRVFVVRIARKRNPLSADKNHIHHHLIRLGLSHRRATAIVLIYTVLITSISLFLINYNINLVFIGMLIISLSIIYLPTFLVKDENGAIRFYK